MAAADWTRAATLIVEVEIPDVYLTINGEYLTLPGAGPHELVLKPGGYRLTVFKGNRQIASQRVTLKRGQRRGMRFRSAGAPPHIEPTLPDKESMTND